jgi:hypothetical protein
MGVEYGFNEGYTVLRDGQTDCIGLGLAISMFCLHGVDALSLIASNSEHDMWNETMNHTAFFCSAKCLMLCKL